MKKGQRNTLNLVLRYCQSDGDIRGFMQEIDEEKITWLKPYDKSDVLRACIRLGKDRPDLLKEYLHSNGEDQLVLSGF